MYKVRIKKLPTAQQGRSVKTGQQTSSGALSIQPTAMGGADIDQYIGKKPTEVKDTISRVPREEANLEAEGGETVYGDVNGDGFTEHYKITGPRHSSGGVPLNLPDDTFIFSDTKSMRIKDPALLAKFGKTKGSYTPAELAKQYDINKYRKILQDPDSDSIDKKTAEMMIRTYNMKLGALALAQESKKGFPQGIPLVARPYMEANGITDEDLMPTYQPRFAGQEEAEDAEFEEMPMNGTAPEQPSMEENTVPGYQGPNPEDIAMTEEMMQNAPMAQYGMSVGDYGMPFYPASLNTMSYGGYPKFQDGGGTASTPAKLTPEEQKIVDEKWNGKTDAYLAYKEAEQALRNDPEFKKRLHEQYKTTIEDEAYYTKGKKDNWYSALKDRGEDEVLDALLQQEERNARLEAFGFKPEETDQPAVKGKNTNKQALDFIAKNPGLSDLNFDKGYLSQAAYIAYDDVIKGGKEKQKGVSQTGKEDELKGRGKISGIDNASTNTTLGQRLNYKPAEKKETTTTTVTTCKCTDKDGKSYDPGKDANGKCNECKPTERPDFEDVEVGPETGAVVPDWTTPDIMNYYGALKDKYSLNKYYPWAAPVDMEEMKPVYLDPTREIAAQSEQANIMNNALAQFTGPQGLSSRASQVQGTSAKQAADTLSRYNNANVQIANQFAANNAQIRNQERAANQGIAKQLYDQTTLTNATFDRDKRLADNVVRQAFATGWKNASDIAMLNATSPQYEIDPRTGTVVFERGKPIQPEVNKTFDNLLQGYIRQGFSPKDAIAAAKSAMGQSSAYAGPDVETIMANAKDGGMYVMGSNVFPFMFY